MFLRPEPKLANRLFRPACKNHLNIWTIVRLIQAEHRTEFDLQAGLFGDFQVQAVINVLIKCQVTPWQVPMAGTIEHGRRAAQQQDAAALTDNHTMYANPKLRFDGSHRSVIKA